MRELDGLRARIDDTDSRILSLMSERLTIVREIARVKKREGLGIYDPEREREMLDRRLEYVAPPDRDAAIRLIGLLIEISKETQASIMEDEG